MGDICKLSSSGIRDPYSSAFIKCVDGRDPMIQKLWFHGIGGLYHEVYPAASIEILSRTTGDFVIKYRSDNWRRNQIIGEIYINDSIQFIGISEMWGSELPYIANYRDP